MLTNTISIIFILCIGFVKIQRTTCMLEDTTAYEEKARDRMLRGAKNIKSKIGEKTILVAIFVRNKEHSLPYFLRGLEDLKYDKELMWLWIVSDHNRDNSTKQLEAWVEVFKDKYAKIEFEKPDLPVEYNEQRSDLDWTNDRYIRLLKLRQFALNKARKIDVDFILYIDADNILMNPYTLNYLTEKSETIIAPMLNSNTDYSNFWGGVDEEGHHEENDLYEEIRTREQTGTYYVPLVHSTFLINLRNEDSENVRFLPIPPCYDYNFNDNMIFRYQCDLKGVHMYIDNSVFYGYLPEPQHNDEDLEDETYNFLRMRMDAMTKPPKGVGISLRKSFHVRDKNVIADLLVDHVFVVSLERMRDRRLRMTRSFAMYGINYTLFEAVDGEKLNKSYLDSLGIKVLPGYKNPDDDSNITVGEIGCFLSHYFIWKEILEKKYESTIIFEDDIRFKPKFIQKFKQVMEKVRKEKISWDFIYLGRQRVEEKGPEELVILENDSGPNLVKADFSYRTISYVISYAGAKKLIDAEPLSKIIAVDEFLPVMYGKQPLAYINDYFPTKNLNALAFEPTIVKQTHYANDDHFISETSFSKLVSDILD
uniref:procollagen galactosyltransferase 1-like n=1 Tax=Styela clava TaxID=7725 RepID=UPI00193A43E9|nr:procollagen galactosyltransferase 1-like [Styela clava]